MVVTPGAIERDAQKGLACVFDRVVEPRITIEEVPIASQITGGSYRLGVTRRDLIGGQHLHDHAIVGLVIIQGLDDPVSPSPDMRLALADLGAMAIPIAVSPDIHPVTSPAFSVLRTAKELIDHGFPGMRGIVVEKGLHLCGGRWKANQIDVDSSQLYVFGCEWQRLQVVLLKSMRNERINGMKIGYGRR